MDRDELVIKAAAALQEHAKRFRHDAPAILCLSRARAVVDAILPEINPTGDGASTDGKADDDA